jgi:hypothetical protein
MKYIDNLYKAVKKRLTEELPEELLTEEQLDILDGVPLSWGNNEERKDTDEAIFAVPAFYFYWQPINVVALPGGLDRSAVVRFTIRVVSESYAEADEANSLHFELVEAVYVCLKGFSARLSYLTDEEDDTQIIVNTCRLVELSPDHEQTNMIMTNMTFETTVHNGTGIRPRTGVSAAPRVTATYQLPT